MIATYNGRPFEKFEASGYSTDEVEEMIDHPRVEVFTNEDAPDDNIRGRAPRPIIDTIEEIRDD